jgi:hypothetical protein
MTEIFHRQNQVTFALHTTPYMRQPWPFQEAVLIEPPPTVEGAGTWFSRSMKTGLGEHAGGRSEGHAPLISGLGALNLRRVSSAPTNLHSPARGFQCDRKSRTMRWMFSALERLSAILAAVQRTTAAFRDVLRRIEREDLGKAGGWGDASAEVRWERVRSCQALLPSAARMRWETFFVREADYKACCKLLASAARARALLSAGGLGPFLAAAGAQQRPPLAEEAVAQAFAGLPPPETDFVRGCAAFADVARDDQVLLQMVVRALRPVIYSEGQIILREGTVATSMYLIKRGACAVRVEGRTVATLRDGDLVRRAAPAARPSRPPPPPPSPAAPRPPARDQPVTGGRAGQRRARGGGSSGLRGGERSGVGRGAVGGGRGL